MRAFDKLFTAVLAILSMAPFPVSAQTGQEAPQYLSARPPVTAAPPQYQIYDIGVVQAGDTVSQGFGVSTGGVAVGRSVRTGGAQALTWTRGGGISGLPNLAGRAFCVSNGAHNGGLVAGSCASSLTGNGRLPVIWQNGAVSQLPLPSGQTLGDANDVNASGVAVGSVNGGSLQRGVVYSGGTAAVIAQTTPNGSFFLTAFGVNDAGRVVGQGIDPTNAARNVGLVYDIGSGSAFEVGALPGANGALAFGVGGAGHVVGSSMQNQGAGLPFIWTQAGGMAAIPLPAGAAQGSARAVNSAGWAVGTGSGQFAVPFLYDGASTYRLADLIPSGTGWDLSTNTSSSALGISDHNIIVGTGLYNGQIRAYAMVPVNRAAQFDFYGSGRSSLATVGAQNNKLIWRLLENGGPGETAVHWGLSTDSPAPADYDGDRRADIAVFRDGTWYWLSSSNNTFNALQFGLAGDVPVPFDYTDDGRAEVAVYRAGVWYALDLTNNQFQAVPFGLAADKAVPADYDGDGLTDRAVFRPATGQWWILRSGDGGLAVQQWGLADDRLVPADYDGDGRADPAVYRNGTWYVLGSTQGLIAAQFQIGGVPLVGDYNGDGRSDMAVYSSGNNTFYWLNSPSNSTYSFRQHGQPNDRPVAGR